MDAATEEAFRTFVGHRSAALLRTAVLLSGGDRHAAEDLLQSALLRAVGRWHRIEDHEAYVRRTLYRQQVNRWRLKWPRRETVVPELPDGAPGTEDAHATAELRIVLLKALGRLTPRQRSVLVLRYIEDRPEAEVARLLDCTVGTVRSTAHRSLARLRALAPDLAVLSGAGDPPDDPSPATVRPVRPGTRRGSTAPPAGTAPVEARP
ncbi:SigE family RNA polymerase sigma factor [Streptomyces sp. NPDC002490]|uniref:SigE family RNA polymerase sigma factor n=1 Tax=Streptomyces sp. NPDC002490 TaxID=3154416 RepID=UPI00331D92D1